MIGWKLRIFASVFLGLLFSSPAISQRTTVYTDPSPLILKHLKTVIDLSEQVQIDYPKQKWFYLTVGSSPLLLTEVLRKQAGPEAVGIVPMGTAKLVDPNEIRHPLPAHWKMKYEELAKLLPSRAKLAGRSVLVIDYTTTGRSFNNQLEVIDRVMKLRDGVATHVQARAYFWDERYLGHEVLGRFMVDLVKAPNELGNDWLETKFDWWAEYESWSLPYETKPPVKNERYATFMAAFQKIWTDAHGCEATIQTPVK